MRQYRRNFLRVLEPYVEFMAKMVVTLHAVDSAVEIKGRNVRVRQLILSNLQD